MGWISRGTQGVGDDRLGSIQGSSGVTRMRSLSSFCVLKWAFPSW